MEKSLARIDGIDRAACRQRVERLFSREAMVAGYERVYEQIFAAEAGKRA